MDAPTATPATPGLNLRDTLLLSTSAVVALQLAYHFHACSFLIAIFLWCVFQLTRLKTSRQTSYVGLLVGMLAYAPQLNFF